MVELEQYFHVDAMQLAKEIHSLLNMDRNIQMDVDIIYDSIDDLCNDYYLKAEEDSIAYVNYDNLLNISDRCDHNRYKWLCKYIVKAIMKDNPNMLGMTEIFCIVF